MPREARINAPGALHHIIIRGIERKAVLKDVADRDNFVERLGRIITETELQARLFTLSVALLSITTSYILHAKNQNMEVHHIPQTQTNRSAITIVEQCPVLHRPT
jgi:hypothetical protein